MSETSSTNPNVSASDLLVVLLKRMERYDLETSSKGARE